MKVAKLQVKFCQYCRRDKPREGFRLIPHLSGSPRAQCADCQEIRKRPRSELVELAEKAKKEKK
jgi:hypothetical protein